MPNTTIKKADGTSGGDVVLSESLFGAKINIGLMHQAVQNEAINRRQDTRNTKTRADVAGGGKKPYRQKGTGRARQGTISAPHYRHGGIVFGPHPRDLSARLPKKARRVAVASALSAQMEDGVITVIDDLVMETHSTKTAAALLKTLLQPETIIPIPLSQVKIPKVLVVIGDVNLTIYKSFRNIPGVEVRVAPAFSVRDVLDAQHIVMTQGALDKLDAVYGRSDAIETATPVAEAEEPVAEAETSVAEVEQPADAAGAGEE